MDKQHWINKHRFYELKHFCLQYKIWKEEGTAEAQKNIKLVEDTIKSVTDEIPYYILLAVTEGREYEYLKTTYAIPCSKKKFYDIYCRFFWVLDQYR